METTTQRQTPDEVGTRAGEFFVWREGDGLLDADCDPGFPCRLYALNAGRGLEVDPDGALFGFVVSGSLQFADAKVRWTIRAGEWFATRAGGTLTGGPNARALVAQRPGYRGVYVRGGPLEDAGRLRYIDGCSDTLLCAPPVRGDPCLNQLHFPPRTQQTVHTHPSARLGVVSAGTGHCIGGPRPVVLQGGDVFLIPPRCAHAFVTADDGLDVIAFHPDSDWGPTHEAHPMLNRTWVDGAAIDNSGPRHVAELAAGSVR